MLVMLLLTMMMPMMPMMMMMLTPLLPYPNTLISKNRIFADHATTVVTS